MADFITTWRTTGSNETITLPLVLAGTYNFTVNYGDGSGDKTVTAWDDADASHEYATADDYTVTITSGGTLTHWSFNALGDCLKIRDVTQWGSVGFIDLDSFFEGCTNLSISATDAGDFGSVTTLYSAFRDCPLANPDTSSWNVSSCILYGRMFTNAFVADPDTSAWDVSVATSLSAFATSSAWSDENYNNALDYWKTLSLQSSVTLDAGPAKKYLLNTSKDEIIADFSWTINDSGSTEYGGFVGDIELVHFEHQYHSAAYSATYFSVPANLEDDDVVMFWASKDDDVGDPFYVSSVGTGSGLNDQGFDNKINLATSTNNDRNVGLVWKHITDAASEPIAGSHWYVGTTDYDGYYAYLLVFRGVDVSGGESTIFDGVTPTLVADDDADVTPSGTSITTNTAGCAIITAICSDASADYGPLNSQALPTDTDADTPAYYTMLGQSQEVNGISNGVAIAHQSAAGATGPVTWTGDNTADDHFILTFALKPSSTTNYHPTASFGGGASLVSSHYTSRAAAASFTGGASLVTSGYHEADSCEWDVAVWDASDWDCDGTSPVTLKIGTLAMMGAGR